MSNHGAAEECDGPAPSQCNATVLRDSVKGVEPRGGAAKLATKRGSEALLGQGRMEGQDWKLLATSRNALVTIYNILSSFLFLGPSSNARSY